jgi:hypothetical protein
LGLVKPFPELYELAYFFGVEPEVMDRDVPWFYNCLTYRASFGDDEVECQIEPGYRQLVVVWVRSGALIARLEMQGIESLRIETERNVHRLVADFGSRGPLDFELQVNPSVHIRWGNQVSK